MVSVTRLVDALLCSPAVAHLPQRLRWPWSVQEPRAHAVAHQGRCASGAFERALLATLFRFRFSI
jgi:hypothetical protein